MKIVILCVNYNSYKEMNDFLKSIENAAQKIGENNTITVVVADNSEKPQDFNNNGKLSVDVIQTHENLGYFGGISYGIKMSGLNLSYYDFIIISNVDLIVPEDFFLKLSEEKVDSNVGCLAPSIFSQKEHMNRNPQVIFRYSAEKLKILKIMYRYPIFYYAYKKLLYRKRKIKIQRENINESDIYAAHGSFMIFTNKFATFLQTMKFPAFLFCEELFIAENLKKKKLRTVYKPNLIVNDIDHISTSLMKSNFYFKCNYESINMILEEYYSE